MYVAPNTTVTTFVLLPLSGYRSFLNVAAYRRTNGGSWEERL